MKLLVVFTMLGLSSCKTPPAPKGEVCLWDESVARCYDGVTDKDYDKGAREVKGYIMRSPDYDQKLANWCIEGWRKASERTSGN